MLDLDGFFVQDGFLVREMGWWPLHNSRPGGSYHYLPKIPYMRLSPKDKRTVHHVQQHVHGLSYYPQASARPHYSLHSDLQALYDSYKTPTRFYVAYKGGTLEKNLLEHLNIPCWNIEEAGCPKFERLARLGTVSSCGQHKDFMKHHCPRVECYHFVQWVRHHVLALSYDTNYVNWSRVASLM